MKIEKEEIYTIDLSDDGDMHLSKDGGPTICTDRNAATPLNEFLELCENANAGISLKEENIKLKEQNELLKIHLKSVLFEHPLDAGGVYRDANNYLESIRRAKFIYISEDGTPCAPTVNLDGIDDPNKIYSVKLDQIKRSSIPIRMEDREIPWIDYLANGAKHNAFYPVNTYEFVVEDYLNGYGEASGIPSKTARIFSYNEQISEDNVMLAKYFDEFKHITENPKWRQSDGEKYLKYHNQWDVLMPCIERLITEDKNTHYISWCSGDQFIYRFETNGGDILTQGIHNDNISAAYKAVVDLVRLRLKTKFKEFVDKHGLKPALGEDEIKINKYYS